MCFAEAGAWLREHAFFFFTRQSIQICSIGGEETWIGARSQPAETLGAGGVPAESSSPADPGDHRLTSSEGSAELS